MKRNPRRLGLRAWTLIMTTSCQAHNGEPTYMRHMRFRQMKEER